MAPRKPAPVPDKTPRKSRTAPEPLGIDEALPGHPDANQTTSPGKRGRQGEGGGGPVGNRKAAGHGAPAGNQNATKHGIWSKLLGDELVDEALALAELPPEERARMHRLIREARVLRAAAKADTPLQALDRGWSSILADLDPDAAEVGGDAEAQGIVVLDGDSEDWMDG